MLADWGNREKHTQKHAGEKMENAALPLPSPGIRTGELDGAPRTPPRWLQSADRASLPIPWRFPEGRAALWLSSQWRRWMGASKTLALDFLPFLERLLHAHDLFYRAHRLPQTSL